MGEPVAILSVPNKYLYVYGCSYVHPCSWWSRWWWAMAAPRHWWWTRDRRSGTCWIICLRRPTVTTAWTGACVRSTPSCRLVRIIHTRPWFRWYLFSVKHFEHLIEPVGSGLHFLGSSIGSIAPSKLSQVQSKYLWYDLRYIVQYDLMYIIFRKQWSSYFFSQYRKGVWRPWISGGASFRMDTRQWKPNPFPSETQQISPLQRPPGEYSRDLGSIDSAPKGITFTETGRNYLNFTNNKFIFLLSVAKCFQTFTVACPYEHGPEFTQNSELCFLI